jgi:hypothetical protein
LRGLLKEASMNCPKRTPPTLWKWDFPPLRTACLHVIGLPSFVKPSHLFLACCAVTLSCAGQSSFQNLGFEEAKLVWPDYANPYMVLAEEAIVGWDIGWHIAYYNTVALDWDMVTLHDKQSQFAPVIFGNYSLLFQLSSDGKTAPAISQVGGVPELSLSLRFTSRAFFYNNHFDVTFNGTELPVQFISSSNDGTLWGADVSGFAGQTGELKFQGVGVLDGIEFSPVAIPEPGESLLVLLGGGVMMGNRRRRG